MAYSRFRLLSDGGHGRINGLDLFGAESGLSPQLFEGGKSRFKVVPVDLGGGEVPRLLRRWSGGIEIVQVCRSHRHRVLMLLNAGAAWQRRPNGEGQQGAETESNGLLGQFHFSHS